MEGEEREPEERPYQIEMRRVRESSIFRLNQIRNENKSVYIMEEINLLIKFNVGIN